MKRQEATLHFQDSRERSEGGRAMFLLFVIELERCRSELGSTSHSSYCFHTFIHPRKRTSRGGRRAWSTKVQDFQVSSYDLI